MLTIGNRKRFCLFSWLYMKIKCSHNYFIFYIAKLMLILLFKISLIISEAAKAPKMGGI
jgi:hypothetical protein